MALDLHFPTSLKTTFPLEIFRLIFDHCDFSTLKCFRLSCHALEVDIAARMFGSLHFDLLRRSLDITRRVADQGSTLTRLLGGSYTLLSLVANGGIYYKIKMTLIRHGAWKQVGL